MQDFDSPVSVLLHGETEPVVQSSLFAALIYIEVASIFSLETHVGKAGGRGSVALHVANLKVLQTGKTSKIATERTKNVKSSPAIIVLEMN